MSKRVRWRVLLILLVVAAGVEKMTDVGTGATVDTLAGAADQLREAGLGLGDVDDGGAPAAHVGHSR